MPQNNVLVLGVNVILTALLGLTTEGYAQLAPADRPPPPPPPPPFIRFAQSGTARPQSIPVNVRNRLIPVAPQQQAARSPLRWRSRSIDTHPAVSQAGYGQSRSTVPPRANIAQPLSADTQTQFSRPRTTVQPTVGSRQPQMAVAPQAFSFQPQRPARPQSGYAQPQMRVQPTTQKPSQAGNQPPKAASIQTGSYQPQKAASIQTGSYQQQGATPSCMQAGYDQPQRPVSGSIISHPAESQVGYSNLLTANQQQAVLSQPRRTGAPHASFVAPSRQNAPLAGQPQTHRQQVG